MYYIRYSELLIVNLGAILENRLFDAIHVILAIPNM